MKKEKNILIVSSFLLIFGGWVVFYLLTILITNIVFDFGIENKIYQYLIIIVFVIVMFVILGYFLRGVIRKLLK